MKKKETHRSRDKKLLLQLFAATFYLSAFTFGGGYVIITLMQKKFVEEYHWIDEEEMFDLTPSRKHSAKNGSQREQSILTATR